MEISHLGRLPIQDTSVMLLTPDVKMVIMKESQNLIFRQYHIQVNTNQNRRNVHIFGYLVGGMCQLLTC